MQVSLSTSLLTSGSTCDSASEFTTTSSYLVAVEQAMTRSPAADGQPARVVHLTNPNGMTVSLMDIGATWLSCTLPVNGECREVLLRSPDMAAHLQQSAYFGAIVGRYANRIGGSQFRLNGVLFRISANEGGNSLHGGQFGFDKRRWDITGLSAQAVTFRLYSENGDQGYPGNLEVAVTYRLTDDNAVEISYQAEGDQDCPVNLTNHAYFNLAGAGSGAKSLDHELQLHASYYLPTRPDLIPTGAHLAVQGTSFDFTQRKTIGRDFLSEPDQVTAGGYDHAWLFDAARCDGQAVVATLISPDQRVTMQMATTKPAVQFYAGNFLAGTPGALPQNSAAVHDAAAADLEDDIETDKEKMAVQHYEYQQHDGLALETQYLPDGPNHPEWGSCSGILLAGEPYQHRTVYRFIY